MQLSEVFTKAKAILAKDENWTRQVLADEQGAYCLVGACLKAAGVDDTYLNHVAEITASDWEHFEHEDPDLPIDTTFYRDMYEMLRTCTNRQPGVVEQGANVAPEDFNDHYAENVGEVQAVLDCAIHDATEKELVGA